MHPVFVFLIALFAIGASSDSGRSKQPPRLAGPKTAPPKFTRVQTTRRWGKGKYPFNDEGVMRDAVRYYPTQWQPAPWGVLAWTDHARRAEVFTFVPHPDLDKGGASVKVYFNDFKDERTEPYNFIRNRWSKELRSDEEYDNRFVHRYGGNDGAGCFLISVRCLGDHVYIYHRPAALPALPAPEKAKPAPAPKPKPVIEEPAPVASNPFMEPVGRIATLQEQYDKAKKELLERRLPPNVEKAALDELDRRYQNEMARLDEEDISLTPL